jgi:hypothetical protein
MPSLSSLLGESGLSPLRQSSLTPYAVSRDSSDIINGPWQMTGHIKAALVIGSIGFFLILLISIIYCIRAQRKKRQGFHRDVNLSEGTFASKRSRPRWPLPRYKQELSKEYSKYNDEESKWMIEGRKSDMILGVGGRILRRGEWRGMRRTDSACAS